MNIFGHLINRNEVVGISPLQTTSTDFSKATNIFQHHFRLYLKQTSILFTSPDFVPGDEDAEGKHDDWINEFQNIQRCIAELTGDWTRSQKEKEALDLKVRLHEQVHALLKILPSTVIRDGEKDPNSYVADLYITISKLSDLAIQNS